jgi:hypothetical protein
MVDKRRRRETRGRPPCHFLRSFLQIFQQSHPTLLRGKAITVLRPGKRDTTAD